MVSINELAVDFELPVLQGNLHKLSDYLGKIVIINFWSVECPHSERTDRDLLRLLERWDGEVVLLSIAANRNESLQQVEEASKARRIPKVLIDADQVVADLYQAVTTPHVFVIDSEGILRYRGAVDDVTFRQKKASRFFLEDTVKTLLEGGLPALSETPAYGCSIVREI
jgi:peroxiredoxin